MWCWNCDSVFSIGFWAFCDQLPFIRICVQKMKPQMTDIKANFFLNIGQTQLEKHETADDAETTLWPQIFSARSSAATKKLIHRQDAKNAKKASMCQLRGWNSGGPVAA